MTTAAKQTTNPSALDAAVARTLAEKGNPDPGPAPTSPQFRRVNLKALPPLPDQERVERWDPVHKGAGIGAIRLAMLCSRAKNSGQRVEKLLEEEGNDWSRAVLKSAEDYRAINKALAESTLLDGGGLVAPQLSDEFLPLLRAQTVMLEGGARVIEMSGQVLDMGRQNGAATAAYANELQAVAATQQQFGKLAFATKKLVTLTGVSNDLLRDAGPSAEAKVRDDITAVMSLKMDISLIRADGTLGTPRGMRYATNAANIAATTQAGAAATFAEIAADADNMKYLLRKNKIARYAPFSTWRWVMGPRAAQYLETVSSTYGVFPFADEMESKGTFRGVKVLVTEALPENLGGGTNESEVYLVAMPCAMVGVNLALELMFFPNGTAVDTGGATISGISADLSWFRAVGKHDFQLAYDTAVAIRTANKWGA